VDVVVAAVDVGSIANIGWWRSGPGQPQSGSNLDELAEALGEDLKEGRAVALGFEAPLFIPRPSSPDGLNRQRVGDRGRPWCAGAGAGALALGIHQATYLLAAVARRAPDVGLRVSFDPDDLVAGEPVLVAWEAFVTGRAKNRLAVNPHVDDARVAVAEFESRLAFGSVQSDVKDVSVLNLVAAGILAEGLSDDTDLLTVPCIVVRAPDLPIATSQRER